MTTHGAPNGSLWHTLARRDDPATSKAAARDVAPRLKEAQARVIDALRGNGGKTATELAQANGIGDPRVFNRRLPELVEAGLVRVGPERPCLVTGKTARTYWLSEEVADAND